uniref:JAB_MPN domain-containing protein n=1 Tax=Rhabditophanes sp. KR3021 TaxID=114890 RepID=A0AC35TZ97_9BILA
MTDYNVKVHPVVYLTVCDAFQRRSITKNGSGRTMGSLCGYITPDNTIHVTNAYVVPFTDDTANGVPALDFDYNIRMRDTLRRTHKSEYLLGWFWTGDDVTGITVQIHQYYTVIIGQQSYSKDFKCPTILFMMDPMFEDRNDNVMPIRAYTDSEASVGASKHGFIFQKLPVQLTALAGERVALSFCKKGLQDKLREISIDNKKNVEAERYRQLLKYLTGLKEYVTQVTEGTRQTNPEFDRKLYDVMDKLSTGKLIGANMEQITTATTKDYAMVNYITDIVKAQMATQEKLFQI